MQEICMLVPDRSTLDQQRELPYCRNMWRWWISSKFFTIIICNGHAMWLYKQQQWSWIRKPWSGWCPKQSLHRTQFFFSWAMRQHGQTGQKISILTHSFVHLFMSVNINNWKKMPLHNNFLIECFQYRYSISLQVSCYEELGKAKAKTLSSSS